MTFVIGLATLKIMSNLARNKALWLVTTILTLAAAVIGILVPNIYGRVMSPDFIPGSYAQDLLTLVVCIFLLILIFTTKEKDIVKHVIILGIIGSFFYLYAIFSIERVYNLAYYLYLAISSVSFWSLISSLSSLNGDTVRRLMVPPAIRYVTSGFSLLVAVLFSILWITELYPLLATGDRIEYLYSIYILDLCFVMPAFVIVAVMVLRKKGLGFVLAPGMFILGIFVIFPLGLGELAKPFWAMAANFGTAAMSFALSAAFIALSIIHLRRLS